MERKKKALESGFLDLVDWWIWFDELYMSIHRFGRKKNIPKWQRLYFVGKESEHWVWLDVDKV